MLGLSLGHVREGDIGLAMGAFDKARVNVFLRAGAMLRVCYCGSRDAF